MRPSTSHRPSMRIAALCVGIASLLAGSLAGTASADPVADKQAEAARLATRIEAQANKTEILAERLNNAKLKADAVTAQTTAARDAMTATDTKVAAAKRRLKGQAVNSYVRGGNLPTIQLLAGGSEQELTVRRAYVKSLTGQEQAALDDLHSARDQLAAQRDGLDRAQREATSALDAVTASQRGLASASAADQATLAEVKGELTGLVAAEQARRDALTAAKVQADIAARDAAQAASRSRAAVAAPQSAGFAGAAPRTPVASKPTGAPGASPPPASGSSSNSSSSAGPSGSSSAGSGAPAGPPASGADAAIAEARRQIGKPYVYGDSGPDSFDCSGLTAWAWGHAGRPLPHSSSAQYSMTRRVAIADLQPGDLVFYYSDLHHVGLYIGGGQMIEAAHTGTNVRYASIYRSEIMGGGRLG